MYTERYYALFAFAYVLAGEVSRLLARSPESAAGSGLEAGATQKQVAAQTLNESPDYIKRTLAKAAGPPYQSFTRNRPTTLFGKHLSARHLIRRPGGELTEVGWIALKEPPEEWVSLFGSDWRVVEGNDSVAALRVVAAEAVRERQDRNSPD